MGLTLVMMQRRQSKNDTLQVASSKETADETPEIMLGDYQRRWTKHPVNSPYGYPLADR